MGGLLKKGRQGELNVTMVWEISITTVTGH